MREFRVVDCRKKTVTPESIVSAGSPEAAALEILGEELMRGGHPRDLRARVYFKTDGQPLTMVRLYSKAVQR